MSEQNGHMDLARQVAVLEERMNTITESYNQGWKLIEAKLGEATASMKEDNAKQNAEFSKLREDNALFREDMAKRDTANTRWLIAVITAATAIIIAVMAVLLSST